jgi:acetyl esterase/lipase
MAYVDRLSRAGVPVEFHMYPRTYHGFYQATNARVTKQAGRDTREALRRFPCTDNPARYHDHT